MLPREDDVAVVALHVCPVPCTYLIPFRCINHINASEGQWKGFKIGTKSEF